MKTKVSELTGAALNLAVAKIIGLDIEVMYGVVHIKDDDEPFMPDIDWAAGGPIIEREMIDIGAYRNAWRAARYVGTAPTYGYGPTPLIAAMRCYVASKLGDEVEIPEELLK